MARVLKKKKVFVGMSGGVDSAVAAALLKKEGYEVTGVFMRQYDTELGGRSADEVACTWLDDRRSAISAAAALDIPFREWDFRKEYHDAVVDYMVGEYSAGRTPNPDVMCNSAVKFGAFLDRALAEGADYVATGHYVVLQKADDFLLKPAKDKEKDQSYFLYRLTQAQLAHCLFPLGGYRKSEVRVMAKKFGLPNWDKKDSQGICFVGQIPMSEFLQSKARTEPGPLMTLEGDIVGTHAGAMLYTIGQRHGVGATGGGVPYFVVDKDIDKNIVYVVAGEDHPALFRTALDFDQVSWVGEDPARKGREVRCRARIRYRQPLQWCTVIYVGDGVYHAEFDTPQRAVTPGQAIVLYASRGMLGGGVIR